MGRVWGLPTNCRSASVHASVIRHNF